MSVRKASIPDSVDLNPIFEKRGLPIRPQGSRGTCSVFTVVGALEYAIASINGEGQILSIEFANWASHKAADRNVDGAFFSELWDGFEEYGICLESELPYAQEFDVDLQPSEACLQSAKKIGSAPLKLHWIKEWDVETGLTNEHLNEIKLMISREFPICGGFRWPKEAKWEDGLLQMCPPSEVFDGHSIILAGYIDDVDKPGGGMFIIRNSGSNSRHGYMSYEYVMAYMNDAAWIEPIS